MVRRPDPGKRLEHWCCLTFELGVQRLRVVVGHRDKSTPGVQFVSASKICRVTARRPISGESAGLAVLIITKAQQREEEESKERESEPETDTPTERSGYASVNLVQRVNVQDRD